MFKSLVDAFCGNRHQLDNQRTQSDLTREIEDWETHLQHCRQQLAEVVSERFTAEQGFNKSKAITATLEKQAIAALRRQDEGAARDIARGIAARDQAQRELASRLLSLRHRENRLQEILANSQRLWRGYRNELQLTQSNTAMSPRLGGRGEPSSSKLRTLQASLARKRQQEALLSVMNKNEPGRQALASHPDISSVEIRQPLEDILGRLRQRAAQAAED